MLRMFRPYNFSWIAGCFSVTMAPRYEMCVGMEKGHKTTKNVQKVEFFNFVKCVQPVLRIHLILMRIRILNPHWKKMDPDPGYFFWWTIQKWGHFYNLFFQKFRVEFSSKDLSAVFGWYFTPWIRIQEAKILRIQILSTDKNILKVITPPRSEWGKYTRDLIIVWCRTL